VCETHDHVVVFSCCRVCRRSVRRGVESVGREIVPDRYPAEIDDRITESVNYEDTTVAGTTADGSEISYQFKTPNQRRNRYCRERCRIRCGFGENVSTPDRMKPRFLQVTKEVRTVRTSLSKDGRTMNATVTGFDAQGKPCYGESDLGEAVNSITLSDWQPSKYPILPSTYSLLHGLAV
jgi:hypothetical protein